MRAVADRRVEAIVVYKVDRLTRSLADFAKIMEALDEAGASFVSVTQAFNTTSSMGRLTLNMLLSFAQFEREITREKSAIRSPPPRSKACGWAGLTAGLRCTCRFSPRPCGQPGRGRKGADHLCALPAAALHPGAAALASEQGIRRNKG